MQGQTKCVAREIHCVPMAIARVLVQVVGHNPLVCVKVAPLRGGGSRETMMQTSGLHCEVRNLLRFAAGSRRCGEPCAAPAGLPDA